MKKWVFLSLLVCLVVSLTASQNLVRTFRDSAGNLIDEYTIPDVPISQRISGPVATPTRSAVMIADVPAFDWSYGCGATSAAMLAGYWDRRRFDNMYAGPTNGGVMPLNNSAWGAGNCPLAATKMGLDNLVTPGHTDRFYVEYLNSGNDPFGTGDPTGTYSSCTADYMGTNQDWWSNGDGSTTIYTYNTLGSPLNDYIEPETYTPRKRDMMRGLKLFFESRGYVVTGNYNQKIDGYNGITNGFTFANYMASIDAGVPVFIQVVGHIMLGVGYDSATNTVYLHDTWDYSTHSMTWGGVYSNMQQFAVSVITLAPATIASSPTAFTQSLATNLTANQNLTISNPGTQTLNYTSTISAARSRTDITVLNENFATTSIPAGWTQAYDTGALNWTFASGSVQGYTPAYATDGTYNACFYKEDYSYPMTKLITPALDLSGASAATLTFWHIQKNWSGDQDELRVFYKTSMAGTWTLLNAYTTAIETWTQETITLPNPSGTYYIGFQGKAGYGYGACVDNVVVTKQAAATPWCTINGGLTYTGSIAVGGTANVLPIGFNSTGLAVGQYTALITITSNSAAAPSYTIPVTLNVTSPAPIVITAPTTGTIWQGGSEQSIAWTYAGGGTTVGLSYSVNGGTDWTSAGNIATVYGANSYSWAVPYAASVSCKIKLVDSVSPNYTTTSNVFTINNPIISINKTNLAYGIVKINTTFSYTFSISNTGTATLSGNITAPEGYIINSSREAKGSKLEKPTGMFASSSAEHTRNTLTYSIPAGSNTTFVSTFAPTAAQAYNGNITITHNAGGANKTIALTGQGGKSTIVKNPINYVVEQAPGQDVFYALTISNTGNMDLNYGFTVSGTAPWVKIQGSSSYSNTIVAGGADNTLMVYISSVNMYPTTYYAILYGTSNDPNNLTFTIPITLTVRNPITITAPAGGESWIAGSNHNITCNYTGVGSTINMHYSIDGGTSWISAGTKATVLGVNNYNWTVPDVASANCLIKLTDGYAPFVERVSNIFTIQPASAGFAESPIPANNANGFAVDTDLCWTAPTAGTVTGYKVYFGTDNPPTNIANGSSQTGTNYSHAILSYNNTYYWKIVPYNGGGDTAGCPVWTFTTSSQIVIPLNPVLTDNGLINPVVTIPDVTGLADVQVTVNWAPVISGFSNVGLQFILSPTNIELPGRTITIAHNLGFEPGSIAYRILPSNNWVMIRPTNPNVILWNSTTVSFILPNAKADGDLEVIFPQSNDETLAVELSSFTAIATSNNTMVNLNWVAQSETNHMGYNLYRSETNQMSSSSMINTSLITNGTQIGTSASYTFADDEIEPNQTYYYWLQSLDLSGTSNLFGPISISITGQTTPELPVVSTMSNAYPNPFRMGTSTTINVTVKEGESGTLKIFNLRGQVVATFNVKQGANNLTWNAKGCASGVYFQTLSTPSANISKKLVIIK